MKTLLAIALLCAPVLLAQQAVHSASVSGTVEDPSGAPLTGASVSVRDLERNRMQNAISDARGRFRFPLLAIGDYELTVSASGFATARQSLRLNLGTSLDVPVRLQIEESASIDVTAAAPLIETHRTQVVATITPEEVHDLPLNGRNYLDLALLAPGVSRTNTGANQRFAETSAVPGTGISVSTQRNLANSFLVDGLSANDDAAELAGTFFSQEVIREFAVVRAGGTAEFGRASAGIINIATHSGTNTLRGDAYAFVRDERLDAPNALTHTKLPLEQKQYGLSIGGPLVRDRMFFFTNAEELRQEGGGVITIAPANVTAINARLDAIQYAGPRITTGAFATTLDTTNFFARADASMSAANQLTLRFNSYDVTSTNARSSGGLNAVSRGTGLENHDRTLAASSVRTLSGEAISETRAQITRSQLDAPPNDLAGPAVTISGIANFGTASVSPTGRDIDLGQLVQNVMLLRGDHALKAGVDLLQNRVGIAFPGATQGVYTFSSLANFLSGTYASYQQAFGDPDTHQTNTNLGVFVQDEWHATPRVTVNAGLRYDVQRLPSLVETDRDNVSPRIGVSWDVRNDGRSVLRAAAGVYYAPIPLRAVSNAIQRNGVTYRVVQVTPAFAGAPLFPNALASFPANVATNVTTIDPQLQNSRSDQATLQYEQQLGASTSASIAYEHLRGREILMSRKITARNTQFQSIGDSWYDGVTLALSKRAAFASARVSYTFSKGLDTSGNFFFSQPQDANDIAAERGRSDNDQRHRLTLSGSLQARGWLLSSIFTYTSALPFNIQLPNDRNGDGNFNDRPVGIGRNAGEGFDSQSLDLRLSRAFPLTGAWTAELIVDAFNVLDRSNFRCRTTSSRRRRSASRPPSTKPDSCNSDFASNSDAAIHHARAIVRIMMNGILFAALLTLGGHVQDSTQAVLPGVTVEAASRAGAVQSTVTGRDGAYAFDVAPGTYDVSFRLLNFATVVRRGVVVTESEAPRVDATLYLASSADVVVTAKQTFRNIADLDEPVNDLIGIADAATEGVITGKEIDRRPFQRAGASSKPFPA